MVLFTSGMIFLSTLIIEFLDIGYRFEAPRSANDFWSILLFILNIIFGFYYLSHYRTFSLRTKLTIAFLAVTVVPLSLLNYLNNQTIQERFINESKVNLLSTASETAGEVDTFIESTMNDVRIAAQTPSFIEFLSFTRDWQDSPQQISAYATLRELNRQDFPRMESYALLNNRGINMLDSLATQVGRVEAQTEYFENALAGQTYVSPVEIFPDTGDPVIYFSSPVLDASNVPIGVLRLRYNASVLQDIVRKGNDLAGEDAFGVLFQEDGDGFIHIAHGIDEEKISTPIVSQNSPGLIQNLLDVDRLPLFTTSYIGDIDEIDQASAIRLHNRHDWIIAFFQPETKFLEPAADYSKTNLLILLALLVLVAIAALGFSQFLANPISRLTEVAKRVEQGDLTARTDITTDDEIGILASAFNTMTDHLESVIENLAQTIEERTKILERRSQYLQAAADVGRAAAEIRDLEDLLATVTHLISDRFGFYHIGILLLDATGEYAVLRASNSEGGWRMMARGHKLRVGEEGIVGYVTGTGEPRVEQSVEKDEIYHPNPELPLTRSEMALPLVVGNEMLGALDVQSVEEQAFSEEDVNVLQVLADEVAIAINNVKLLEQLQERLETERKIYGEISQQAWTELLSQEKNLGFRSDVSGITPADDAWRPESEQALRIGRTVKAQDVENRDKLPASIPIKVHGGTVIGVLETHKPASEGPWTSDEINLLETIGEQLGIALENARLFEETQRLAYRERIAADVSGKVWASTDVDTILQTAVQELGRALNVSLGTIRLEIDDVD
jgi:GAF domain-containing protein/HAMP domain-containing protein